MIKYKFGWVVIPFFKWELSIDRMKSISPLRLFCENEYFFNIRSKGKSKELRLTSEKIEKEEQEEKERLRTYDKIESEKYKIVKEFSKNLVEKTFDCDVVNNERHLRNHVGNLWKIRDPNSVHIGDCFFKGRLKEGDLVLCIEHCGDCFQNYIFIEKVNNCLVPRPQFKFGSYGIGNSIKINLTELEFNDLKKGNIISNRWGS